MRIRVIAGSGSLRLKGLALSATTLPEVLLVLGIIALIAALVVPTAWISREYARKVICVGRLHMLYTAIMTYTADHDRRLPIVVWRDLSRHPADTYPDIIPPDDYSPPWPKAPEPPPWYTLRVSLGDYVDSPQTFFCPSYPRPLPELVQYSPKCWMSYSENDGMAGMSLDELTWPPDYAALLNCPRHDIHLGHYNVLYLTGRVASEKWPGSQQLCLRTPWSRAGPIIKNAYGLSK